MTQMTQTIPLQQNIGAIIGAAVVSIAATVIILILVMIIMLQKIKKPKEIKVLIGCLQLYFRNMSYYVFMVILRFTESVSKEKNSRKDEFSEFEIISIKATKKNLVSVQPTNKGEEINLTSCPAYGEVKNIYAYQNKEEQPDEVPGVYETIK